MRAFANLYTQLDERNGTNAKLAALVDYFRSAAPADAAHALAILRGDRPKRLIPAARLREALQHATGHPDWLIEETYAHVGDLAETIALLTESLIKHEPCDRAALALHHWFESVLPVFRALDATAQIAQLEQWWSQLPVTERFVLMKLITGGLRVGVSAKLVQNAIAQLTGLSSETVASRLAGGFKPSASAWSALVDPDASARSSDAAKPYPFCLASPLDGEPQTLGQIADFAAEWKWDGIRVQAIRRGDAVHLYSRGEEMLDGRFPEVEAALLSLPTGLVIDGELLAFRGGKVLSFAALQKRIGRLKPGKKLLADTPVALMAYDLLEADGVDLRTHSFAQRRALLDARVPDGAMQTLWRSALLPTKSWQDLAKLRNSAREHGTEGLMLKRLASPYVSGRRRGDWWKWKIAPLTIDAVLTYAQAGHGRRANLYTDYTFALWDGEVLVTVAKAYSGLDDQEIAALDRWIRKHTVQKFGPVRQVEPVQVFELAFEGVNVSNRHKSGIAVRFPRIARWRTDKTANQADCVLTLRNFAVDQP